MKPIAHAPTPSLFRAATNPRTRPMDMAWRGDGISDSPQFMSDPFNYITQHPELFNDDLIKMAQFQLRTESDQFNVWSQLLKQIEVNVEAAKYLRQKSERADQLAQLILTADVETLQNLSEDSTFADKKALLEALAALPEANRGVRAIDETIQHELDWSYSGQQARFDRDLQRVVAKVAEANTALQEFDDEYSVLFLSVRKLAMQADAACERVDVSPATSAAK